MTFAHPWFLLLLLLLPLFAWLKGKRGRPPAFVYSAVQLVRAVLNVSCARSGGFLAALRWFTLALFILALARPQFTKSESNVTASGVDIIVAFDLSFSMAAEDFEIKNKRVNRMELAKQVLREFIQKRPNDRIGLVVFGTEAYIAAPPTLDHEFLLRQLNELELGRINGLQTAIGSALSTAINRLRDLPSKSRIVILMTDGQNNAGKLPPLTVAEAAQALNVKVYTIGIGTRGEAPMPVMNASGHFILDFYGRKQYRSELVDIDEETLQKISELTQGKYFRADHSEKLQAIYAEIDQLEKTEVEVKKYTHVRELFPWLLPPGLGLLLVEILLRNTLLRRLP